MKVLVMGADPNALTAAIQLQKAGHQVEVLASAGVESLTPGSPLAADVSTLLDQGATLEIVGRVGVNAAGQSVSLKLREITGEVSDRDKERWKDFVKVLNNASDLWRSLYALPATDVVGRWREFGRRPAMEVLRLPWQSLSELLNDWFESDLLKATLAATALRGSRQGSFSPGSAFLLLQRWARGEVFGRAKPTEVTLRSLAEGLGISFHSGSIQSFQMSPGAVAGVVTGDGQELTADLYVTTEDAVRVLKNRVGLGKIDPDHQSVLNRWDNRSTTAVAKLPASDQWSGAWVNFCEDLKSLEKAYDPTKYGKFSEAPFAEFDSKSGFLYLQHLGCPDCRQVVSDFCAERNLGEIEKVWMPTDVEAEFGATGGHLFGGERFLWQSYTLRESLRHPLSNLYLCGASTGPADHSGLSGLMVAHQIAERPVSVGV